MDVRGRTLGCAAGSPAGGPGRGSREAVREPRGEAEARLPGPHGAPGSRGQPALPPPRAPRFENLVLGPER